MKFGINAQVIIALLGALYILMVCKEKYRIEYAEGEPVAVEKVKKKQLSHKGPRPAVMPKPGSVVAVKAKKNSVAKAPIVAVKAKKPKARAKRAREQRKAKKIDVIEEEEEDMIEEEGTIEGQAMIEEGMSTGAIVGITAVSIVALIAIMIMMRRLRR